MTEITICPNCKYEMCIEQYAFGECPKCHEWKYYWDSDEGWGEDDEWNEGGWWIEWEKIN